MIGSVIGSYKVTEKIGEGGMGAVFKGIDTMLEREVAIKMLRPELASQPDIVERFRTEAVTLAKLNHPNIATLYSFLRQGEDFFMVMEFVRGQTLDDVIRKFGAIDCNRAIALFCQALEGIEHAHRMGIVHRDIKPANIMLTNTGSIKVMDFGIARVLGTARLTRQGNIVGTVEYMAPEQVRGSAADARSDIYSLGILLYEMLTGRVPFEYDSEFELMRAQVEDAPKPPRTFTSSIPLAVEQAIMRALAKKPEARPQTAGELRAALLATLGAPASMNMTTPPYAAPTTNLLDTPSPTTGETAAKQTLLSAEREVATQILNAPAAGTQATGDQLRETQIVQPLGPTTANNTPGQQTTGGVRASTSLVARLNWKHYAAAAMVVIALIAAVAFALRASRGADPSEVPPAVEEATAPSEAPEGDPAADQNAAPSDTAETGVEPAVDPARGDRSMSAANANVEKGPRSRGNRHDQPSEAQSQTSPGAPAPVETSPSPAPAASQPPPPADTASQSAEATNKEASATATQNLNKNEKKKGGIGGFFKKVFKGSDKKNANKNSQ
jgi:serine/threonine-protein kinase